MFLVVRTGGEPTAAIASIRDELRQLDPNVPLYAVHTMNEVVGKTLNTQKLMNTLLTSFAVLALLLASIGVYGVMAVYVVDRTREFGIRLAIGAQPSDIFGSVLKEGALLTAAGVFVGAMGALALTRFLASVVYEVSVNDPATFLMVPFLLAMVAMLTCAMPAYRAARTSALSALRYE